MIFVPVYLQTGTAARFDFEGNLVTSDEGIDVKLGLHHHGNEPEVRDLLMLCLHVGLPNRNISLIYYTFLLSYKS